MRLSIVIPTFNETAHIRHTVQYLREVLQGQAAEIIVADGGSTDDTIAVAENAGAIATASPLKGRAAQMNWGARQGTGDVLYFLHADTVPPKDFARHIRKALQDGYAAGCFRLRFDIPNRFLRANCWFTRFDVNAFRFGDQSLFIRVDLFQKLGGFCEGHIVLEDQEIIRRIKRAGRFRVMRGNVTTSARKYLENGVYRTQGIFFLIYLMWRLGYSQQRLVETYRRLIRQDKL